MLMSQTLAIMSRLYSFLVVIGCGPFLKNQYRGLTLSKGDYI